MSPPMGNSSAKEEQKPVAKYIGDLDSPRAVGLENQRINHEIDQRCRIQLATEGIPSPEECKDVVIPEERSLGIGGSEVHANEYVYPLNQSKIGSNPSLENALPHTEPLNTGLLLWHQTTSPQNGGGWAGDGSEDQQAENKQPGQNAVKVKILSAFQWHTKINRQNFCECENRSCDNCKLVTEKIKEYFDEGNLDWAPVVGYHWKVCKFQNKCEICARLRQEGLAAKQAANLIIWKNDDVFGDLSYFKEGEHFHFKDDHYFAKGGFGEVHHIELPQSLKEKYFGQSCPTLVLKKTIVRNDEKYLLKHIANHPKFVKTLLLVQKREDRFTHRIVMEKCEISMRDYLGQLWKDGKSMEITEAVFYWQQAVDAVAFLHSLRIIHKDIKAANLLLKISGNMICVKLTDFGMVKRLHNNYTRPGLPAAGTRGFMAPEVVRKLAHGCPADIYSLAKLLLQMLFKDWKNEQVKELQDLKCLDKDVGALIERCLDVDEDKRYTAVQILQSDAAKKYKNIEVDLSTAINRLLPQ